MPFVGVVLSVSFVFCSSRCGFFCGVGIHGAFLRVRVIFGLGGSEPFAAAGSGQGSTQSDR